MNRIEKAFARAREENRAVFVGYLCAGDPDFDSSVEACRAVIESGVDVLEIGVPFSCLLYTSPSPRDATLSRMPSSA